MRFLDILGPNPSRETVDRVVGELHALLEVVERQHGQDRTEDLFPGDRHIGLHAIEHRRLDVVALAVGLRRFAARDELGALIHALLDVPEHRLLLLSRDERAEARVLIEWIAGPELPRTLGELVDDVRVYRVLDQQARARGTDFSLAVEDARLSTTDCGLQISI